MTWYIKYLPHLLVAVVLSLLVWGAYDYAYDAGYQDMQAKCEKAERETQLAFIKDMTDAILKRDQLEVAIAAADKKHQQELQDAEAANARLVASLRNGTERLRSQWRGCQATTAQIARSASELDAEARLREQGAADLIGAGREADKWIEALQEVIKAERN